jgi:L-asparagine transporter-like permease
MNSALYMASRMVFSLARSGEAPASLGVLNARGVPARATLVSSVGTLLAAVVALISPNAFQYLVGIALFGGIYTWIMVLVTHIKYRRAVGIPSGALHAPFFPYLQIGGLLLLAGVLVSMAMDASVWRFSVIGGLPWIVAMTILYGIRAKLARKRMTPDRR